MSKLQQIKDSFRAGQMDKAAFIQAMSAEHSHLFAYSEWLGQVNIAELRIRPGGIVAAFRDPGVLMECPAGDIRIAPMEALNFGDYEREEVQFVRRVIDRLGGAVARFLDIGANAGFYSLALAHYFPGIRGLAFEPVPQTFALLQRNLELNGVTQVQALNLGLSDQGGELLFYTYPSLSAGAAMRRNHDAPDMREVRCAVVRLDDYSQAHETKADFIKCDVEGAELFVFRGGEKLLARDCPAIFAEMLRKWCAKYDYHPNDLIRFFSQLGYGCFVIRGSRLNVCAAVTEQTVETNFFFLHRERHAGLLADWVD